MPCIAATYSILYVVVLLLAVPGGYSIWTILTILVVVARNKIYHGIQVVNRAGSSV